MHWIRVETAGGRSLTPWVGLDSSVHRRALECWPLEHWTFVLWALKRWHHFHGVLVNWMSLHTAITRVPRTTSPLQLCDGFMSHLEEWFVKQPIPEGNNQ